MNNIIVKRSQIVEAQFTGTIVNGRKYAFTQEANLSRKKIMVYGFEAYTDTQLEFTPSNNPVIQNSARNTVVITFVDENNIERIYQLPYTCLMTNLNGGFVRMVKPFIVDLTKSYVQCINASSIVPNESACLNLYYTFVGE
jgi:hypothetical protein